jgi:hypothetical protein
MDNETNLAAWMIGRGRRVPDPADVRDQVHRQVLAAARPQAPGLAGRVASVLVAVLRREPACADPACCPA